MKKLNLIQGSPEWHAHRATALNASDAPVMLGLSKYKSRSQLLKEKATGLLPEIDAATQRRFNDGHRFEALARPLAEEIIGEELSPVTGAEGAYSASFDGLPFDNSVPFEHKTLNNELRAVLSNPDATGADLDLMYRVQMEQQLLVCGGEKVLFMASNWDANDQLLEVLSCWYMPDAELRARIVAGWEQFGKDLAGYVHEEATPEAVATPIRDLPTITYKMNGMAVLTNLHADVKPAIVALVEQSRQPLETDQDFADLDLLCKHFATAEEQCKLIAAQVDAEFKDTDKFKKDLLELQEIMAAARIAGKKRVASEKDTRKLAILSEARAQYAAHVAALELETSPLKLNLSLPDFALAIKCMAKLDNMKGKCADLLASSKLSADATAKDVRAKLAWCKDNADGYSALFPDLQQLIAKPMDDFALTISSRIDQHKAAEAARLEAERARIQAEATAKAEREAAAKLAAEEARIRAEERAKESVKRAEDESQRIRQEEEAKAHANATVLPEVIAPTVNLAAEAMRNNPPVATKTVAKPTRSEIIKLVAEHWDISIPAAHAYLRSEFFEVTA